MEEREKVKDSQGIISGIAELIYEIRHDRQLSPIPGSLIITSVNSQSTDDRWRTQTTDLSQTTLKLTTTNSPS